MALVHLAAWLLLSALLSALSTLPQEPVDTSASVGVPVTLRNVVIAGPELVVRPVVLETPVVVRILDVYAHGDAFRYDFVVYGLDPGEYDLTRYLQRRDGSPAKELTPLSFHVTSVLPPGQVEPNPLSAGELPEIGGYTRTLWIGGAAWIVGLAAILFGARKRRAHEAHAARPASLADRLRPLVEDALAGRLSRADRAALELTLIAVWRKRLALEGLGVAAALAELKLHAEAGPLLRCLEDWLHRPEGTREQALDLEELLAPYRELAADEYETGLTTAGPTTAGQATAGAS